MEHQRVNQRLTRKNNSRTKPKTNQPRNHRDKTSSQQKNRGKPDHRNIHHEPKGSRGTMGRPHLRQVPHPSPHHRAKNIPPTQMEHQHLQQRTHKDNRPNRPNNHNQDKIQKQQTSIRSKLQRKRIDYRTLPLVRFGRRFLPRHFLHLVAFTGLVAPQPLHTVL